MTERPTHSDFETAAMGTSDRAARLLGAMRCLERLVTFQVPLGGVEPEPLAYMLSMLNDEAEALLPIERMRTRPRAMNDEE